MLLSLGQSRMQDFSRLHYSAYLSSHIWYSYFVHLNLRLCGRHATVLYRLYLDLHLPIYCLEINKCLYLLRPGYCLSVDLVRSDILFHLSLLLHILRSLIPFLCLLRFLLIRSHPLLYRTFSSSLISPGHLLLQSFYICIVLVFFVLYFLFFALDILYRIPVDYI